VKEEADYDADLDTGYRRLAVAAAVVQVALAALVPAVGELGMAYAVTELGMTAGTASLAVTGTAMVGGAGGTFLAEGGRQVVTGDYDADKLASRVRQGTVLAAGAGAPGLTRTVAGGLETAGFGAAGASSWRRPAIGEAQNLAAGGPAGMGAVTGGLGWAGGKVTTALPKSLQTGLPGHTTQAAVGAGVNFLASGGDETAALTGAAGGFFGSAAMAQATGGGGTGGAQSGAAPPTPAKSGPKLGGDLEAVTPPPIVATSAGPAATSPGPGPGPLSPPPPGQVPPAATPTTTPPRTTSQGPGIPAKAPAAVRAAHDRIIRLPRVRRSRRWQSRRQCNSPSPGRRAGDRVSETGDRRRAHRR
jgi:hypothetical protein